MEHFRFGLHGSWAEPACLLTDYPVGARNISVECSYVTALNTILSNQDRGDKLLVRNFSRDKGSSALLAMFNHLAENGIISRSETSSVKSVIDYTDLAKYYKPERIVYEPKGTILVRLAKGEPLISMKIDSAEKKDLNKRLRAWWSFILEHNIDPGVTDEIFQLFNRVQTEVEHLEPLVMPEYSKKLPYFSFNDKKLTQGGRMQGAFWIGMKKVLRRLVMIDGESTADIDGKGMHVQLLYRRAGKPFPKADPYIYEDHRRAICKKLMLYAMNTKIDNTPEAGRPKVVSTFRRWNGEKVASKDELFQFLRELEELHHEILPYLYKCNWGGLQKTEASIMLAIMEAAMKENIVVLPVHDGCLCQRKHTDKVLQYFADQDIEAVENQKHLWPVPIDETKQILMGFDRRKRAI
ncbi:MAG: hypothetical protein KKA76_18065 [Proteobacteria bacterium]|nr:hypothetical protein [Pseudomonadota bacterium]